MVVRITGRVVLRVGDKTVESIALFDTGATKSFVDLKLAKEVGFTEYEKPKEVLLAVKGVKARVIGYLVARVEIEGFELPLEHVFGVIDGLRHDVVIGMDIIEPYEIILDVIEGRVKFKRYPSTIELV